MTNPTTPAAAAPWPSCFPPAVTLLAWLEEAERRLRPEGKSAVQPVLALRWLVLAELDRTAPEPEPKPDTLFL